jgi:hypothetical protein
VFAHSVGVQVCTKSTHGHAMRSKSFQKSLLVDPCSPPATSTHTNATMTVNPYCCVQQLPHLHIGSLCNCCGGFLQVPEALARGPGNCCGGYIRFILCCAHAPMTNLSSFVYQRARERYADSNSCTVNSTAFISSPPNCCGAVFDCTRWKDLNCLGL